MRSRAVRGWPAKGEEEWEEKIVIIIVVIDVGKI